MKLHLKIFSKNKNSQILFTKSINRILHENYLNLNCLMKNYQQTKTKQIFTVLKSPHANKTAQEQFQCNITSRRIGFYTFRLPKLIIILQKLQKELFPDVLTKIYLVLKVSDLKKFKNYRSNPKLYQLKIVKYRNINKFSPYLTFFDFCGGLKLKFV